MCGVVCLHGECIVKELNGAKSEECRCFSMYSGSQCSVRKELMYWELSLSCTLMIILLGVGIFVTNKARVGLRFRHATTEAFEFPRELNVSCKVPYKVQTLCGRWTGPTRKGLPTKVAEHYTAQNALIYFVVLLEFLPWVQIVALSFLPVVPWPRASRDVAEILRLSVLFPFWKHSEPNLFPKLMLYLSVIFVPGTLIISCVLGAKRFPLLKPQPKSVPAEDLCTLLLRFYSEWLVLPIMIGLLLPLECGVIGYNMADGSSLTLFSRNDLCFTISQGGMVVAGSVMLILYCIASSVIVFQLNCESSLPTPTLWTHIRYTQAAHVLKAPLAMSVVGSVNANAYLLCVSCTLVSLILGVMNANLKPCIYSLVNEIRLTGAIIAFWTSVLALVTSVIDDPSTTLVYEYWYLGAAAISAISVFWMAVSHFEYFRLQLVSTANQTVRPVVREVSKGTKMTNVSLGATKRGNVAAIAFRKIMPTRRSSAAEKLRSLSKHGNVVTRHNAVSP